MGPVILAAALWPSGQQCTSFRTMHQRLDSSSYSGYIIRTVYSDGQQPTASSSSSIETERRVVILGSPEKLSDYWSSDRHSVVRQIATGKGMNRAIESHGRFIWL